MPAPSSPPATLTTLPPEVLARIMTHVDFPDMERALGTCRELWRRVRCDDFYRDVAIQRWSVTFWRQAFSRRTWRTYISMRDELRQIHQFECMLRRHGLEPWSEREYRTLWKAEHDFEQHKMLVHAGLL